jgi:hypothetical protein
MVCASVRKWPLLEPAQVGPNTIDERSRNLRKWCVPLIGGDTCAPAQRVFARHRTRPKRDLRKTTGKKERTDVGQLG